MKKLLIFLFLFISLSLRATTYYVATTGNDSNAGTISSPWATWHYAFSQLNAGDILYIRGGTYSPAGVYSGGSYCGARLAGKQGTSGSHITIRAYSGETPILNCVNVTQTGYSKIGLHVDYCDYIDFVGLTVTYMLEGTNITYPADGWDLTSDTYITFNQCNVTHCGNGFFSSGNDYISYTNCDSYDNSDRFGIVGSGGYGGYADGFGAHQLTTGHVTYTGCRAWHNSDDGWDAISSSGYVTYTNCWSFLNGSTSWDTGISGDGNGFKLGFPESGTKLTGNQRTLINCLSFNNKLGGYDESADIGPVMDMALYHCVAYANTGQGYYFNTTGGGYIGVATAIDCIAYANDPTYPSLNVQFRSSSILSHNSWTNFTVTDADFLSVGSTGVAGTRQADGSLPILNFLKLSSGSQLRGAGVAISGLTTDGVGHNYASPPSIGAYENGSAVATPVSPVYTNSTVENATPSLLTMTYNLTLANYIPVGSAFSVLVNSVARTVNTVAISGNTVQLTLASAIKFGDIVTVSYTKPATNPLQTATGGLATSISAQSIINNLINPLKDASTVTITMTIFPNHVHKIINVLLAYSSTPSTSLSPEIIRILDISGKLFIEKLLVTGVTNIKIPLNLESGIYTVIMLANGVQMASQKMIVY
jgi:uncharacterized repeat protein (TIGR02059 family)